MRADACSLLCVIASCSFVQAAPARSYELGLGMTSYQLQRTTRSETGQIQAEGTSFYHLHAQYHWAVGSSYLSPYFHYMPPSLWAAESAAKSSQTSLTGLGISWTKPVSTRWDLTTGPLLLRYSVKGKGGLVTLNNGESTSTFFLPSEEKTSQTIVWQGGAAFLYDPLRYSLDLLIHAPLGSVQRSYSLMTTLAWTRF
jgi:hypothetical protein